MNWGGCYRYGFNGMEKDDEISGSGNSYTTFERQYDARIARWVSTDPIFHEYQSAYAAFDNNPIYYKDPSGASSEGPDDERINDNGDNSDSDGSDNDGSDNDSKEQNTDDSGVVDGLKRGSLNFIKGVASNLTVAQIGNNIYNQFSRAFEGDREALIGLISYGAYTSYKGKEVFSSGSTADKTAFITENALFLGSLFLGEYFVIKSPNSALKPGPYRTGSGPVAGVLEVSPQVKSVAQFKNYNPSKAIEFVFDPHTNTFVVGSPKAPVAGLSPHQNLAKSIGANNQVVGGLFKRGSDGRIITNEASGHFYRNWTPEVRKQFQQFLENQTGQSVVHTQGPSF
ncbi:polymorphic toxin type 43 domain-containing protein [Cytophagaceae bacterium ABcell3]|nr:polymorphic toxin type 43 domain-containing protein [Cytophagaceae bacterium ABcell3]